MMTSGLLAHQGGWDEVLLVALPLLIFAGLVWNAKRRAQLRADVPAPSESEPPDDPSS